MAALVVNGRDTAGLPSFSSTPSESVQRDGDGKPKAPKPDNYDEAARKIGDALQATAIGKQLKARAAELGDEFLSSVEGKMIAGTALGGALAAIIATNSELPVQVPEIPLDFIKSGLRAKLAYEGPVRNPTNVGLTLTSKSGTGVSASYTRTAPDHGKPAEEKAGLTLTIPWGGSPAKPKSKGSDSDKYRAKTARMAAEQGKFREGLKTSAQKAQDKADEQAFLNSYLRSRANDALHPLDAGRNEDDLMLMRKAIGHPADAGAAPPIVHETLAEGGYPLDSGTRAFMEERFGYDFSHVRIHADAKAAESAEAVNAHAYTVGSHIVFGAGRYVPHTTPGRGLLAHELTHVVQQSRGWDSGADHSGEGRQFAPNSGLTAAIGLRRAPKPPARRTIKAIVSDLRSAITSGHSWQAPLAGELAQAVDEAGVDPGDFNDIRDAIFLLVTLGFPAEADHVIAAARRKYLIAFSTEPGLPIPNIAGALPRTLVDLGQAAARKGEDGQAFTLLEAAQELLSEYAIQASENASGAMRNEVADDFNARSKRYGTLKEIYDELRRIHAVYGELERDALDAGKSGEAARLRKKGEELRQRLKADRFGGGLLVELAEASPATNRIGQPALRYHGADFAEIDITALPGHPLPAEATGGQAVPNVATIEGTQDVLVQQAGLIAELSREPAFRKAFGEDMPDLNDRAARQKAWRVMYGVYARRDAHPLGALMSLIGRYLKAFTIHTSYNVRDSGPSYLDSRMPSDLTGRMVSDCGVYALEVAWDVFETVKQADPKLKVSFTLATLLDHVVLIIADESAGQWYYVSNDRITPVARTAGFAPQFPRDRNLPRQVDVFNEDPPAQPPEDPDRDEEIGRQYGELRDLPYLVAPVNYAPLGSTKDNARAFKTGAWRKYQASTGYMAKAAQPGFARVPITLANLRTFSDASKTLDLVMDQIAAKSGSHAVMANMLQAHFREAATLLVALEQLGPRAFRSNPRLAAAKPAGTEDGGFLRAPGRAHPLLRMALGLARLKALGQSLSGDQQRYLDFFEAAFAPQMDALRPDAEAGRF